MDLAREPASSSWLTSLPIEEHGVYLHKGALVDALGLRYAGLPPEPPQVVHVGLISP